MWVSPGWPGREHDTTRARHHGLTDALNRIAARAEHADCAADGGHRPCTTHTADGDPPRLDVRIDMAATKMAHTTRCP